MGGSQVERGGAHHASLLSVGARLKRRRPLTGQQVGHQLRLIKARHLHLHRLAAAVGLAVNHLWAGEGQASGGSARSNERWPAGGGRPPLAAAAPLYGLSRRGCHVSTTR